MLYRTRRKGPPVIVPLTARSQSECEKKFPAIARSVQPADIMPNAYPFGAQSQIPAPAPRGVAQRTVVGS